MPFSWRMLKGPFAVLQRALAFIALNKLVVKKFCCHAQSPYSITYKQLREDRPQHNSWPQSSVAVTSLACEKWAFISTPCLFSSQQFSLNLRTFPCILWLISVFKSLWWGTLKYFHLKTFLKYRLEQAGQATKWRNLKHWCTLGDRRGCSMSWHPFAVYDWLFFLQTLTSKSVWCKSRSSQR